MCIRDSDPSGNILVDDNEYSDFDHASFAIQGLGILQEGAPPPPPPPNCALTATSTSQDNTVYGGNNGSITAVASNGTSPITYSWTGSNGYTASAATINSLPAGTYSLTVTDKVGCTASLTVDITEPSPPQPTNMLIAIDQGAVETVNNLSKSYSKNPAANIGSYSSLSTNNPMVSIAAVIDSQGAPAIDGAVFIPPGPYSGKQVIKILNIQNLVVPVLNKPYPYVTVNTIYVQNWKVVGAQQLGYVEPGESIPRYSGGILPQGVSVLFNRTATDMDDDTMTVSVFYDNYTMGSTETIIEIPIKLKGPTVAL
jgi:hypothetical protein